jgi:hypothetical protein
LPLLEKVRVEIFLPQLPDLIYGRLLEDLSDELSYAFGGCTVVRTSGKYRSDFGVIVPDTVNILFTDTPFQWKRDRKVVEAYAQELKNVVQRALENEEAILIIQSILG